MSRRLPVERRRLLALAVVAAVAVAFGLVAHATGLLAGPERSSIDARFDIRGPRDEPREVALVLVDDETLDELGEQWPFRRSRHAQVIDRLRAAGARAIAYDVQFTEETEPAEDNALIEAVARTPRVVLATTEVDERGGSNVFGGDEVLREIGARAGNAVIDPDPGGAVRRFPYATQGLVSFPIAAVEAATGRRVPRADFPGEEAWIDYAGPPGTVRAHSFSRVLRGRFPPDAFRGRIVVVGVSAPSLGDVHSTSTSGRESMAGAEVVANEITTVLDDFPLRSAPGVVSVALIVMLGLVAPAAAVRLSPLPTLLVALATAALFLVAAQLLFVAGAILPVATPLAALLLGTLGALGTGAFFAALERERTRALFARFVPEQVVDDVLARTDEDVRLGGVRVDATVLFSDLRSSTSFFERVEPEQGIEVLNRYLTEMSEAVLAHGGTLVGYRGDGLMALFGAPLEQPDHARRALRAALEMTGPRRERLAAWMREHGWGEGFGMGVGLNSGPVMAGNVGSDQRMEYTGIGDATNVAARLEGLTKGTGHAVFVADATRALLPEEDRKALERVGDLEVRGRAGRVTVWAPRAERAEGHAAEAGGVTDGREGRT